MRFWTIWSLHGYPLRERLLRTREWFWGWLAHRLPRPLAYWSLIDTGARYSTQNPKVIVPEMTFMDVLEHTGKGVER